MSEKNAGKSTSGMAVAGLVLGIVAAVSSWIPIINNMSFVIAAIGVILAIVGLVGTLRGRHSGKVLAIAAVVMNVVAIVIVLGTQGAMSAAIDEATNGPDVASVTEGAGDEAAAGGEQASSLDLAVGSSVDLESGLTVTVDSVETGIANYDGSTLVGVHVTYANGGEEPASYNTYDWKGEDADGAQEYSTFYADATDDLSSGTLAAGGTKSGTVYFPDGTVKALYFGSMLSETPVASWTIG